MPTSYDMQRQPFSKVCPEELGVFEVFSYIGADAAYQVSGKECNGKSNKEVIPFRITGECYPHQKPDCHRNIKEFVFR